MGLKQCPKCSEMVDEAKAFCPACGNAFVEEESRKASQFDQLDNTVQLGNTMYNQMLSDMGLNLSKQPEPGEERVEPVVKVEPAVKRTEPSGQKRIEVIVPAAAAPAKPAPKPAEQPKPPSSNLKWWLLGGVVLLLLFLLLAAAAAALYIYWTRYRVV